MEGTCKDCGQKHFVEAADKDAADRLATMACSCDGEEKKRVQLLQNLKELCGEDCRSYGFLPLKEDAYDLVRRAVTAVMDGDIDKVTFEIFGTTITIAKTAKGKTSVIRKKSYQWKLEA